MSERKQKQRHCKYYKQEFPNSPEKLSCRYKKKKQTKDVCLVCIGTGLANSTAHIVKHFLEASLPIEQALCMREQVEILDSNFRRFQRWQLENSPGIRMALSKAQSIMATMRRHVDGDAKKIQDYRA